MATIREHAETTIDLTGRAISVRGMAYAEELLMRIRAEQEAILDLLKRAPHLHLVEYGSTPEDPWNQAVILDSSRELVGPESHSETGQVGSKGVSP